MPTSRLTARRRLAPGLLTLLFALPSASAQEWTPAYETLGSATIELEPSLGQLISDGPAARAGGADHRSMTSACWLLLALSAGGSNLRNGPHRKEVKNLVRWVRNHQALDGNHVGRYSGCHPDHARFENTLATFAVLRTGHEGQYKLLAKNTRIGLLALRDLYTSQGSPRPTSAEAMLLAMMAATAKGTNWNHHCEWLLDQAARGAEAKKPGRSRHHDAIRHYVSLLRGEQQPHDLTMAICWPGSLEADPLHAWFGSFVARALPAQVRRAHWPRVAQLLKTRQPDFLWFDAKHANRFAKSAMLAGVVGMGFLTKPAKSKPEDAPGAFR